ncbi:MAG: DUF721 domain-containing protein [Chitinophagales bacterium]|nr:DUF721 domain-containing protein [Bacteroidota bacterium]MCB9042423.1 DUF721 domain-containing protein [Chitinophagales bacterium]
MKKNEVLLKDALQSFFTQNQLTDKITEAKIRNEWKNIVGEFIANHTQDIKLKDAQLHLTITSAPLKKELAMLSNEIIAKTNTAIGQEVITKVILR